jgi:hypothetical protein
MTRPLLSLGSHKPFKTIICSRESQKTRCSQSFDHVCLIQSQEKGDDWARCVEITICNFVISISQIVRGLSALAPNLSMVSDQPAARTETGSERPSVGTFSCDCISERLGKQSHHLEKNACGQ